MIITFFMMITFHYKSLRFSHNKSFGEPPFKNHVTKWSKSDQVSNMDGSDENKETFILGLK